MQTYPQVINQVLRCRFARFRVQVHGVALNRLGSGQREGVIVWDLH